MNDDKQLPISNGKQPDEDNLPNTSLLNADSVLDSTPVPINPFSAEKPVPKDIVPWVLEFRIGSGANLLQVKVRDVMTVGRGIGAGAPDVDLTPFDAHKHGVSRRHAIIMARNKFLTIRDLNSTNNTFLNGLRLTPDQDVPLEHGDHIRFGRLETQVRYAVVPPDKLASTDAEDTGLLKPLHEVKGEHILILEDDVDVAAVYQMMLTEAGYRVTITADPTEAAATFAEDVPDAVIIDLIISTISTNESAGLDLLRLLRNRAQGIKRRIPFIVVSALPADVAMRKAKAAGATLFLPKPIRIDELVMRVGVLINDTRKPLKKAE